MSRSSHLLGCSVLLVLLVGLAWQAQSISFTNQVASRAEPSPLSPNGENPIVASKPEQADSAIRLAEHAEPLTEATRSLERLPPLSPEDEKILAELPYACVSGLPGLTDDSTRTRDEDSSKINPKFASLPTRSPLPSLEVAPFPRTLHADSLNLPNPHAQTSEALRVQQEQRPPREPCGDPHAEVFERDLFPSALECRKCHAQIYDEWAISGHANAGVSPVFHKFEQRLNSLAQGTLGYFCYRCHAPVATTMRHPRWKPIYEGPRVFREGVTCVVCHRVAEQYAKTNGERRLEPGALDAPVYGSGDGMGVEYALKYGNQFKVKADPADKQPGQLMHRRAIKFEQLSRSDFCMSCHQVAVHPNIKLEVVWEQYRNSPAYGQGIRCQDCHMGKVPGLPQGFTVGPAAVINDKPFGAERRHSNHLFYGPGYSIAHPGIFPFHPEADRWSPQNWLAFDWRAGWGTEAFEQRVERGEIPEASFPPAWADAEDRRDAREILTANFKRLAYKDDMRRAAMENGSRIDGPFFSSDCQCADGTIPANRTLKLHYVVTNTNSGHNLPTASLGAQPQLWLNAVLVNPVGQKVWETGYLDTQSDLADVHSIDVHQGKVPFDRQLVNYQTKFLITNLKGTDREMPLPVNIDIDQLPFLRPAPQPVSVMNHPPFIRMEAHSLPPLGYRRADYVIPAEALTLPGFYRLSIRMRSRIEPPYFMRFIQSTDEMIRRICENTLDFHRYTVTFEVR